MTAASVQYFTRFADEVIRPGMISTAINKEVLSVADDPKSLSASQQGTLMNALKTRFGQNMSRHKGLAWNEVAKRLQETPEKLWPLNWMEQTGGEPDVVDVGKKTGVLIFADCAPQSPSGRRSLCFDEAALESRKRNRPAGSACGLAEDMGVELLTEEDYRFLQSLGEFDTTTSSWLWTPPGMREKGGALFGDRRYGRVFIYHNGAESYYAARGFRGKLAV